MATLKFYINTTGFEYDLETSGSGLAFFGDGGFGESVAVGAYQGTTYVSDGAGATQGAQGKNIKWINACSGQIGAASSGIGLKAIPNYQSTLNVRFTHDIPIQTQNVELRIYDRSDINVAAVGVTTKVAEIIHTSALQGPYGSGDECWITPEGSGVVVELTGSPGPTGIFAGAGGNNGRNFDRHDWFLGISSSPDSIGNKTSYGLYFALEYL